MRNTASPRKTTDRSISMAELLCRGLESTSGAVWTEEETFFHLEHHSWCPLYLQSTVVKMNTLTRCHSTYFCFRVSHLHINNAVSFICLSLHISLLSLRLSSLPAPPSYLPYCNYPQALSSWAPLSFVKHLIVFGWECIGFLLVWITNLYVRRTCMNLIDRAFSLGDLSVVAPPHYLRPPLLLLCSQWALQLRHADLSPAAWRLFRVYLQCH